MQPSLMKRLLPSKQVVRRGVLGLAAFLLLFSVFGYLVLPVIVKTQAQRLIADKLQREATIGAVEIDPYALSLTVREFRLLEPKGGDVFAGFDALRVNLSLQSVLQLAPVVQELRLDRPYVHLVRTDAHRYNIDDILERLAAQPPSEQPARFSVNNIQVAGGSIRFDDRPAKATHTVDDLALGVPFISSLPSQVDIFVEPSLSANVNGTPLHFKGKARPFAEPKDARVELNLDGLDLTRALGYLPFKPRFGVPGARLDLHLTASFLQPKDKAPSFRLSGTAALKAVRITGADGKQILSLPELAVSLQDMDLFGGRFEIARLLLDRPEVDIVRGRDGELALNELLPPPNAARTSSNGAAASAGFGILLRELEVRGAALRYRDEQSALKTGAETLDLTVRKLAFDSRSKAVRIDEIASGRARLLLERGKANNPAPIQTARADARAAAGHDDVPAVPDARRADAAYVFSVGRIAVNNWAAHIEDRSQEEAGVTDIARLSLALQNLSTAPSSSGRVELDAILNRTGRLAINGSLGLAPFNTDLALDVKGVDILPLQPYVTDAINLRFTRANLSGKGRVRLARGDGGTLKGGFGGDFAVDNVATVDKAGGNDFLRWKSLSFGGVDMRFGPFAFAADQIALNDFFARIIIDPSGRINLQDIARGRAGERNASDVAAPEKVVHVAGAAQAAPGGSGARAAPAASDAARTPIRIGKLTLQGGRVRFTDNFIKPNYSASLSDFGGAVTDLSSDPATHAGVDLRAEVNGAPLSVAGRINPLKGDLFMDIQAKVRGMELAPLSAYSGRYVGYGIEKGRLSFEVAYLVEDRRLTAENRLILEQITFGEKIDSPSATKLPVQFAVALLRDNNGVIDINLPIAGSLDDPEFSVAGVVFRALGRLIVKAASQPFAVLASLFGGGSAEELSSLAFEPGRFAIPAAGEDKLRALSKALVERPGLTLDIAGHVDRETDREGLKRVSVTRKVRALKFKELAARGAAVTPGSVTVSAEEYPSLLMRAYKDENFPKPRNILGLPKDLPVAEMEALMAANAEIDEDDLITLGNQRAQAVKNWLVKHGQVPAERMFILAPKLDAQEAGSGASAPVASRVDFVLR